jgi:hypothetical protein
MDHEVKTEQRDLVRPGEQWFFYWKTSAALWESRIREIPPTEVIFLPVYWGWHADSPTAWDFHANHPEKDLLRLARTLTQHGRKFCWLLPLTPSPFLPNGGVPVGAAKTLSLSPDGIHLACLDHELNLNKMHSFFEPKVFQSFTHFTKSFGEFLASNNIKAPVWGMCFHYPEKDSSRSFIEDSSLAFEQGFSRYLKRNHPGGIEINAQECEENWKRSFTQEVQDLFIASAEASLGPYWSGHQHTIMLGSSPQETIERALPGGKSQFGYFKDIFRYYARGEWISSSLLTSSEKKDLLPQILREHFGTVEIEERFRYRLPKPELDDEWRAYGIAEIYQDKSSGHFQECGLLDFMDEQYRWMYQLQTELNFTTEVIEANQNKVKFFHGASLDRTRFGQMLKLFLMGQKVVLDRSGLHPDLIKRLEIFYLENNLKLQNVNFQTHISLTDLGEGRFITLDGEKLKGNPERKKFWNNLFRWFQLAQPEVLMDKEVFGLWRIRATGQHDLNFLDVRRFSLYNPTSYKKTVTIHTQKHFAFMKSIDPRHADAKSVTGGVEVELRPGGKVSLDFGHYEEGLHGA